MKKLLFIIFLTTVSLSAQTMPFTKGINLTNWFQTERATSIQFTKYTYDDFVDIKSLGVDVIRLPINLHSMTKGAPDYDLDPLFLYFLDQVVDWAEDLQIHLLLDNHTFDPASSTNNDIDQILIPVWQNMAEHFKDRSNYIYYEILNEPHGISDSRWNEIQQLAVQKIREIDTVHTLIVGPAGWNSYNNLSQMPVYSDNNLIYTFHFYDPFLFSHQGASWTDPPMGSLGGVPFPYDINRMPACPDDLKGTWVESSLNNSYKNDGTIQSIRDLIDIAVKFKTERNVPIFCGEFGILMDKANDNDRTLWYSIVRQYFEMKNIAWTTWDYHGGFGLFEKNSTGLFNYDLNINLVKALGFNAPPQSEFESHPDTVGFNIYMDFIENGIYSSSSSSGNLNFYNENSNDGKFAISWSGASQYGNIGFDFRPDRDLSLLENSNYVLEFFMKGNSAATNFDLRFIDTKTGEPEDHPWRMNYRIDFTNFTFDNQWHKVRIPLSSFVEGGSWDNQWYNPEGKFDWKAIDIFQFVSEAGNLAGEILIDNIKIYDPNAVKVENEFSKPISYLLDQNFPNPFNPETTIQFSLGKESNVKFELYNILGQKIIDVYNKEVSAGKHSFNFKPEKLNSGNYFLRMEAINNSNSFTKTIKISYLK